MATEGAPAAPAAVVVPPPAAPPPAAKPPFGMDAAVQLLAALGAPTGPNTQAPPAAAPPATAKEGTPAAPPPPATEAPPPAPPPPSRAAEFAKQARKERALLDQQRAQKAQADQLAAQKAELDKLKAEVDARMQSAGETEAQRKVRRSEYLRNPALFLKDAGLTLEQLAEAVLRDGAPDPAQLAQGIEEKLAATTASLDEKLAKIEQARLDKEKADGAAREAASKKEQEEAVLQVKADIAETVKAEPDKYEMISYFGDDAKALVYKAIEAQYEETGEVLSYGAACDKVEAYLDERVEGIAQTKKFGSRFKPREVAPPPAPAKPAATATLGNVGAAPTAPARKHVTEEERWKAAEEALRAARF